MLQSPIPPSLRKKPQVSTDLIELVEAVSLGEISLDCALSEIRKRFSLTHLAAGIFKPPENSRRPQGQTHRSAIARHNEIGTTSGLLDRGSLSQPSTPLVLYGTGNVAQFADQYNHHYYKHDPFRPHMINSVSTADVELYTVNSVTQSDDFYQGEYYWDFLRKRDSHEVCRFAKGHSLTTFFVFMFERDKSASGFSENEFQAIEYLAHNIESVLDTEGRIRAVNTTIDTLLNSLERQHKAAFVLNTKAKIVACNTRAQSMLSERDTLEASRNMLQIRNDGASRRLHDALMQCHGPNDLATSPIEFAFHSDKGRPLHFEIVPFADRHGSWSGFTDPLVLVTITDLRADLSSKAKRLGELFDLTGRELAVAGILAASADEHVASATLDISINTLRTHRKKIYSKLNLTNRAELAALIARLP
ncbi:MAG: helix-turn-helix transcriptional regulator [Stappiaceae bacterium]